MPEPTRRPAGFSLLELMISVAIMLVVGAAAFSLLLAYQQFYQSSALKADMHSGLRAATELLEQEIGQAGVVSLTATCSTAIPATTSGCPTLAAGVNAGSAAAFTVTPSPAGMFVGEYLNVDVGSLQETIQIKTITSSSESVTPQAGFLFAHPTGTVLGATGMFPQGILSPGQTGGSTASQLNLIGDLVGDGNLYYVQYTCTQPPWAPVAYSSSYSAWSSSSTYTTGANVNYNGTSYVSVSTSSNTGNVPTAAGTLTRSVTELAGSSPASAQGTAVPLLDDLGANPGGAPCFQYGSQPGVLLGGTTYIFTPTVSVTLTVQTGEIDPITKIPTQETKSFLNLVPRNVVGGYNLAKAGFSSFFQPNPSALCTAAGVSPGC